MPTNCESAARRQALLADADEEPRDAFLRLDLRRRPEAVAEIDLDERMRRALPLFRRRRLEPDEERLVVELCEGLWWRAILPKIRQHRLQPERLIGAGQVVDARPELEILHEFLVGRIIPRLDYWEARLLAGGSVHALLVKCAGQMVWRMHVRVDPTSALTYRMCRWAFEALAENAGDGGSARIRVVHDPGPGRSTKPDLRRARIVLPEHAALEVREATSWHCRGQGLLAAFHAMDAGWSAELQRRARGPISGGRFLRESIERLADQPEKRELSEFDFAELHCAVRDAMAPLFAVRVELGPQWEANLEVASEESPEGRPGETASADSLLAGEPHRLLLPRVRGLIEAALERRLSRGKLKRARWRRLRCLNVKLMAHVLRRLRHPDEHAVESVWPLESELLCWARRKGFTCGRSQLMEDKRLLLEVWREALHAMTESHEPTETHRPPPDAHRRNGCSSPPLSG